jgi:host factor-I protein
MSGFDTYAYPAAGISGPDIMKSGINIQDQFLNQVRKERTPISIHLLDGREVVGLVRSFDNFCIFIDADKSCLIYKHAISDISILNE